jgi:hypothetical protein
MFGFAKALLRMAKEKDLGVSPPNADQRKAVGSS